VTYGTVLKRDRRELHGRVAAWLVSQAEFGQVRTGDVLAIIAHHFEAAGEDVRAADYHARAAEHAADRFAHSAVLAHAARALSLLDASEALGRTTAEQVALRWRVVLTRQESHHRRGERTQQRLDLEVLDAIASASGDDGKRAEVALGFGLLARATADWPATERHMREAIQLARAAGDDGKRIQAQESLAIALRGRRQLDDALALAQEGLAEATERGLQRSVWGFYRALALIFESQGDEVASAEMEREALNVARESGYQVGEAIGLDCMGQVAILLGDLAEAQRWLEDAVRLQRQLGLHSAEAHALAYLAAVLLWRGDAERALAVGGEAIDIASATRARYAEAWAKYRVGEAQAALSRHAEASTSFMAAAAIAHEIGNDLERTATAGVARAALAQGDLAGALGHVERLLSGPQPDRAAPDTTFHPELVAFTCYEVLARAGDPARAAACLSEARALMHAVAGRIPDMAQRQAHLAAVPHRRAIAAE
jgi:tetratricopeptide (TPR) repeat protein